MKATLSTFALLCALCFALRLTPPAPADTTPAAPGNAHLKALYTEKCSACHNLPDPAAEAMTRPQWQRTVTRMLVKYKASDEITEPEAAQIVNYLATFAPKLAALPHRPNGARGPSWDTDAGDVWPGVPVLSRIQTFEDAGALASLSPLAPGMPARWHVAGLTTAPDGQFVKVNPAAHSSFAALVDPKASGRDVDVRVRFQVVGGRALTAAGIAFGVTDAQNYYVLRCDTQAGTLSVMKVSAGVSSVLQSTPIALPIPPSAGAQTVFLTPRSGNTMQRDVAPTGQVAGWHTLRLMARGGFLRGWVDMQKRVSVRDDAYAGGQVGLWTGGDTIAAFDDWTTDVYAAP